MLRYAPGAGWTREFLLSSSGAVSKPLLRGVAWPEPGRAHAVGDLGAMWMWRAETGLWERDPAAPDRLRGQPDGRRLPAGRPAARLRGRQGGRRCCATTRPGRRSRCPTGFADRELHERSRSPARGRSSPPARTCSSMTAAAWRVDEDVRRLFASCQAPSRGFVDVAGLPDGGAVAAGPDFVIERDGPSAPWRFSTQPLLGVTPVALAAFRVGRRRARAGRGPAAAALPGARRAARDRPGLAAAADPAVPAARRRLPRARDRPRLARRAAHRVRRARPPTGPSKSDPIGALLVDARRRGLGARRLERRVRRRGPRQRQPLDARAAPTARACRPPPSSATRPVPQPAQPPALARTGADLPAPVARFAIGGHAAVRGALRRPARRVDRPRPDAARGEGPRRRALRPSPAARGCCSTRAGGCRPTRPLTAREAARYAELLQPGAPAYAALSAADTADGTSTVFSGAFAGAPAPFGGGFAAGRRHAASGRPRRCPARARTTRSTPRAPAAPCG